MFSMMFNIFVVQEASMQGCGGDGGKGNDNQECCKSQTEKPSSRMSGKTIYQCHNASAVSAQLTAEKSAGIITGEIRGHSGYFLTSYNCLLA
jgi:hypothetical protein